MSPGLEPGMFTRRVTVLQTVAVSRLANSRKELSGGYDPPIRVYETRGFPINLTKQSVDQWIRTIIP